MYGSALQRHISRPQALAVAIVCSCGHACRWAMRKPSSGPQQATVTNLRTVSRERKSARLRALEARLDDEELGGVDHERHARHLGVADKQVDELGHRGHAVDEAVVHVDVEQVRALVDLYAQASIAWLQISLGNAEPLPSPGLPHAQQTSGELQLQLKASTSWQRLPKLPYADNTE
jgi:hypothetical protein